MTEQELKNRLKNMTEEMPPETQRAFMTASLHQKEEKKVKKKLSAGLILAFALIVLTMGAALAASDWDIARLLDIWQPRQEVENDPTQEFTYEMEWSQGNTDLVTFELLQAYHDGASVYSVVRATPKEKDILLLGNPQMTQKHERVFWEAGAAGYDAQGRFFYHEKQARNILMKDLGPDFADSKQTLGEYMNANGKTRIVFAFGVLFTLKDPDQPAPSLGQVTYDWVLQADGSLLILRSDAFSEGTEEVVCNEYCYVETVLGSRPSHGYREDEFTLGRDLAELAFSVKTNQWQNMVRVDGPFIIPGLEGYQADWVTLTVSPFGLNAAVSWRFPAEEYLEEPKAEDIQIISGVKLAVDDAHETDRTNSSVTFDLTSEWASTHRNCYGLQKTHFSDLTSLPESVDLVYGDQRVTVKLSQTE